MTAHVTEDRMTRIKRLRMRSMRRGIKEMDLILDGFAGRQLDGMDDADVALYEDLLAENDHDIYGWISGQIATPARYDGLIRRIAAGAVGLTRPA